MTFDGSANRGDPNVIRSELDERTDGRAGAYLPGGTHVAKKRRAFSGLRHARGRGGDADGPALAIGLGDANPGPRVITIDDLAYARIEGRWRRTMRDAR